MPTPIQSSQSLQLIASEPRQRLAPPPPAVDIEDLGIAPESLALLDRVRRASKAARLERQIGVAEAHRLLVCPGVACVATELLVRTLGEVLGRRPVLHAPGARLASFDEAWLLRCHAAQAARDIDSLAFLTARRVPGQLRRPFLDLLRLA